MKAEEIGELEILVNKLKFKAGQKASDLHDRKMTDFEDIPYCAESTYTACKEWNTKNQELLAVRQHSLKI